MHLLMFTILQLRDVTRYAGVTELRRGWCIPLTALRWTKKRHKRTERHRRTDILLSAAILRSASPGNTRSPAVAKIADRTGCQGHPGSMIFMSFKGQYATSHQLPIAT